MSIVLASSALIAMIALCYGCIYIDQVLATPTGAGFTREKRIAYVVTACSFVIVACALGYYGLNQFLR